MTNVDAFLIAITVAFTAVLVGFYVGWALS